MLKKLAALASTTALLVALPAGAAQADPKGLQFTLDCGDQTFTITTTPNEGDWTPGFVVDSTSVIRPVAFGEITFTVTFGGETVTETEPPMTKPGRIPPNADLLTCDFNTTFEEDGGVITVSGSVTGFLTGR